MSAVVPLDTHEVPDEIRAFLALELGLRTREVAADVAERLRGQSQGDGVRWVRRDAYHVTLRFLGDIPASSIAPTASAVSEAARDLEPFELTLGDPLGFPSARRPRVIALALSPRAPLERLAAAVERGAVAAGHPPERRAFRAHLTLGRVRSAAGALRARGLIAARNPESAPSLVCEVVLLRSQLSHTGSSYSVLERIALGASNHPPQRRSPRKSTED